MTYKKAWKKEDVIEEVYSAIIGEHAFRAQQSEAASVSGRERVEPSLLLDNCFNADTSILVTADELRELFCRGFLAGVTSYADCMNDKRHFLPLAICAWEKNGGKWLPAHYGELVELQKG